MAIKCIGILTSGGDATGMNAAIRAVTRTAIYNGYKVKGIMRGYHGLVTNEIVEFKSQSVSNIIQKGGTILKTARSKEFRTEEGRRQAYENMKAHPLSPFSPLDLDRRVDSPALSGRGSRPSGRTSG